MPNYFDGCQTEAEVKQRYRQLARENHPDLGGDTATMQEINNQYQKALKGLDGKTYQDSEGKERTYHYREELEKELVEIIDKLLALKMENVDVYLIGVWLWAKGDTKPYREQLKEIKTESVRPNWSNHHQAWTWHLPQHSTRRSGKDLSQIAATYGATRLTKDDSDSRKPGKKQIGRRKSA